MLFRSGPAAHQFTRQARLTCPGERPDRRLSRHGVRRDRRAIPGLHSPRHDRPPADDRAGERHGACGALHSGLSRSATAVTLEIVIFDQPGRVTFRLVRGPVPYVTEESALTEHNGVTTLAYSGQLGTDFGIAGQWGQSGCHRLGRGSPRLIRQHPGRSRTPRQPLCTYSLTSSLPLMARIVSGRCPVAGLCWCDEPPREAAFLVESGRGTSEGYQRD